METKITPIRKIAFLLMMIMLMPSCLGASDQSTQSTTNISTTLEEQPKGLNLLALLKESVKQRQSESSSNSTKQKTSQNNLPPLPPTGNIVTLFEGSQIAKQKVQETDKQALVQEVKNCAQETFGILGDKLDQMAENIGVGSEDLRKQAVLEQEEKAKREQENAELKKKIAELKKKDAAMEKENAELEKKNAELEKKNAALKEELEKERARSLQCQIDLLTIADGRKKSAIVAASQAKKKENNEQVQPSAEVSERIAQEKKIYTLLSRLAHLCRHLRRSLDGRGGNLGYWLRVGVGLCWIYVYSYMIYYGWEYDETHTACKYLAQPTQTIQSGNRYAFKPEDLHRSTIQKSNLLSPADTTSSTLRVYRPVYRITASRGRLSLYRQW